MQSAYDFFYELFLTTEITSLFGPFALVILGYFIVKKYGILGIFYFIVESLFIAHYLNLVDATPFYWWHILILIFGSVFFCIVPLVAKQR